MNAVTQILRHRFEPMPASMDTVVCVPPKPWESPSSDSCLGCGVKVTMEEVSTLPPECRALCTIRCRLRAL